MRRLLHTFSSLCLLTTALSAGSKDKPWFLYVAPYAPHVPLTPPGEFNGKTKAGLYGDYVFALDHGIGRLLSALDETGQADNTVVIAAAQPEEFARLKALHLQIRGPFTPKKKQPPVKQANPQVQRNEIVQRFGWFEFISKQAMSEHRPINPHQSILTL